MTQMAVNCHYRIGITLWSTVPRIHRIEKWLTSRCRNFRQNFFVPSKKSESANRSSIMYIGNLTDWAIRGCRASQISTAMPSNTLFKGCVQIVTSCERHKATELQWREGKGQKQSLELFKHIPGGYDDSIDIQIVYTVTTQTDFMWIVIKIILNHFIINRTILIF